MLVAVVLTFVITEFPNGLLAMATATNDEYFRTIYTPLGDLFDDLVLFNSFFNFVLYTTMSQRFRDTFRHHIIAPFKRLIFYKAAQRSRGDYKEVMQNGTTDRGQDRASCYSKYVGTSVIQ